MPSLLSRFLGKKKNADQPSLLDGEKYEAVPKTTSPSAATFADATQRPKQLKQKETDKSNGTHGRRKHSSPSGPKLAGDVPVLSLSLPESKGEERKSQGLGVVFEGLADGSPRLSGEALGERRLTPQDTLILVQKTSEVISERGLETLGVMRPHWFASSRQQEVQLKLIHRFLQTLSSPKSNGAASASSPSFESELRYARDPHDVAAVLRWGLRHFQLEGNSFGSSDTSDWYRTFAESERTNSYPPKAFDDILVPLLPVSHTQLLRTTLDLVSSLAAHSEENGISGNKLSKVLGWWIVSTRNEQGAEWQAFYAQWEVAARQFEHLFLAYIRAQEAQSRMPKRLTELVKGYPFPKSRREDDGIYLPRSRFSTRSANALFVKVTADKSVLSSRPHPLRVVEDAFKAKAEGASKGQYAAIWEEIRKIASTPSTPSTPVADQSKEKEQTDEAKPTLNISNILTDESIRLLSLVPTPEGAAAPSLSLITPLPSGRGRRSLSVGDRSPTANTANGHIEGSAKDAASHVKAATSPPSSYQEHDVAPDWQLFSSSGFQSPSGLSLAASLWDTDTEVSLPASKKSLGVGKRNLSIRPAGASRRGSVELPPRGQSPPATKTNRLTYGAPRMVKLDEAFIDFWADSLLDSVARTWPTFVVCQLKASPTLRTTEDNKPVEWLIIERVTDEPTRLTPPAVKTSAASARAASPVQSSPTKSEGAKSSKWAPTTLSSTRKRWSFFSPRHESAPAVHGGKDRAAKKAAKDGKVGEMGEILHEEDEGKPNGVEANGPKKKEAEATQKKAEKPQDVSASPTAHQVNGVSKPAESAAEIPKKAEAAGSTESSAAPAEYSPVQGLAAVAEEPSEGPKQVAKPAAPQEDAQPDAAEQAVTEQAPQGQPTSEPTHVPEVPALPAISAPAEHPEPSPAPPTVEEAKEEAAPSVPAESEKAIPDVTSAPVVAPATEAPAPVEHAQVSPHTGRTEAAPSQAEPIDTPQPSAEPEVTPEPESLPEPTSTEETQHEDQPASISEHVEEAAPVAPEPSAEPTPPVPESIEEPSASLAAPVHVEPAVSAVDPPAMEHAEEPASASTPSHEQPDAEETHDTKSAPANHEEHVSSPPARESEPDVPHGAEETVKEDAVPEETPADKYAKEPTTEAAT